MATLVTLVCQGCHKKFSCTLKDGNRGRRFCSRACWYATHSPAAVCAFCSKEFRRQASVLGKRKGPIYCSKDCMQASWRAIRAAKYGNCVVCGQPNYRAPRGRPNRTGCCSRKCAYSLPSLQRTMAECATCGKSFHRPPSHSDRQCCSRRCAFEKIRAARKRCAVCGKQMRWRGQTYCSWKCSQDAVRRKYDALLLRRCKQCGTNFRLESRHPSTSLRQRTGEGTYCSLKCRVAAKRSRYTDIQLRWRSLLTGRVYMALRKHGARKVFSTEELIGCSREELRLWIESQFQPGMNWQNHGRAGKGKWHIDHIRPCVSFDLTNPDQQRECFHWSNLRPLWSIQNCRKNDRWNGQPQLPGIMRGLRPIIVKVA